VLCSNALLSLTYLNQELNAPQTAKFIAGRFDSKTGLASNSDADAASLRATVVALQNLDLLGERKSAAFTSAATQLLAHLSAHAQGDHFEFPGVSAVCYAPNPSALDYYKEKGF
jgi:hypothetical protein